MKTDIIIAGVGGQGIVSIATIIGYTALKSELYLKQSEVHGMSQRGGAVQSHLRISDKPIASDIIPLASADLIISVEPMEALRYLPYLSEKGWLVTNSAPFININNYPDLNDIYKEISFLPYHIILDADDLANQISSRKSSNMIILGASAPFFRLPKDSFREGISTIFERKGSLVVNKNLEAFEMGFDYAERIIKSKFPT